MNYSLFDSSHRLCNDDCAKEAKDIQNDNIFKYEVYQHLPVDCDNVHARYPEFSYNHVNLHGRVGYGVAEGCIVDNYSALRTDPAQLTRDRCRLQLFSRIFQGCPNLRGGMVDPDLEMPVIQGLGTRDLEGVKYTCKKALMELQTNQPIPMLG